MSAPGVKSGSGVVGTEGACLGCEGPTTQGPSCCSSSAFSAHASKSPVPGQQHDLGTRMPAAQHHPQDCSGFRDVMFATSCLRMQD